MSCPNIGSVHVVLQGKGGVGKSLIASALMQYLHEFVGADRVQGVDTDPTNQTLAGYPALKARHLPILAEHTSRVDESKFDELVTWIIAAAPGAHFVVDTGGTSFLPLTNYLLENDIVELLRSGGRTVRIHTVVTGGQSMLETLDGFAQLARHLHDRSLVVWVNEFFGPVEFADKAFEDFKAVQASQSKILGKVRLTMRNPDTFGRDMRELLQRRLTLAEAIDSADFNVVSRQRYKIVRDDVFRQLSEVEGLLAASPQTIPVV